MSVINNCSLTHLYTIKNHLCFDSPSPFINYFGRASPEAGEAHYVPYRNHDINMSAWKIIKQVFVNRFLRASFLPITFLGQDEASPALMPLYDDKRAGVCQCFSASGLLTIVRTKRRAANKSTGISVLNLNIPYVDSKYLAMY